MNTSDLCSILGWQQKHHQICALMALCMGSTAKDFWRYISMYHTKMLHKGHVIFGLMWFYTKRIRNSEGVLRVGLSGLFRFRQNNIEIRHAIIVVILSTRFCEKQTKSAQHYWPLTVKWITWTTIEYKKMRQEQCDCIKLFSSISWGEMHNLLLFGEKV